MAIPLHKAVSSMESLTGSIETDNQVYRWFLFLITHPQIESQLSKADHAHGLYAHLKKVSISQKLLGVSLTALLLYIVYFQQYFLLWIGPILLYLLIKLYFTKKRCVVKISAQLLSQDFKTDELIDKTLYQIGEFYAQKYHIPSMVDTIYAFDNISRRIILILALTIPYFYPFELWQMVCLIPLSYYLVSAILNSSFIYKKFK